MTPRKQRFTSATKPDEFGVMTRTSKAAARRPTKRKRAGQLASVREKRREPAAGSFSRSRDFQAGAQVGRPP